MNAGYARPNTRTQSRNRLVDTIPVLLFLLILYASPAAAQYSGAFVWADNPTSDSYVPSNSYSYNSTTDSLDSEATITRTGTGVYRVTWQGLEDAGANSGTVQVSAYGTTTNYCGVGGWGTNSTTVYCFDTAGDAADSYFTAWMIKAEDDTEGLAYAWANDPSSASYTPSSLYSYNPTGGDITITRSDVGFYNVVFSGYDAVGADGGNVQVSTYGGTNNTCKVSSWAAGSANVKCYDTSGDPVDEEYTILFAKPEAGTRNISYAWASDPTNTDKYPASSFYAFSGTDSTISVLRNSVGNYTVTFDGFGATGFNSGNVIVSSYFQDAERCNVGSWSGDNVVVRCWDVNGAPADSYFNIMYWRPEKPIVPEELNGVNYAWGSSPSTDSYTPDLRYMLNQSGMNGTITRTAAGDYRIHFDELASGGVNLGTVQLTSYASPGIDCQINNWSDNQVNIDCVDQAGTKVDSYYSVLLLSPVRETDGLAYTWANQPTSDEYVPTANYTYNAAGGDVVVTRSDVGRYFVTFNGFEAHGDGGGHVQVTSYGSSGERCNTDGWGGNEVGVVCFDLNGDPVDSRFNVLFLRPKTGSPGMAYAWANDPTLGTYSPSATYSYNPTGGLIRASRSDVGSYSMSFQNYESVGANGGNVQVSAYGAGGARCYVDGWNDNIVYTRCVDAAGDPVDSQYNVLYLKPTEGTGTAVEQAVVEPGRDSISNYPNPFSEQTTITYSLEAPMHVTLTVHDLTGRRVSTLVDGMQSAGDQMLTFEATGLASGVYFYSLRTEKNIRTGKMTIQR